MATNPREYQRAYMSKYRKGGDPQRRNIKAPFVGCDGEGTTLDNGYHAYNMLRIGDQLLKPATGHVRLTTLECLDFITSLDPKPLYVGYFFDYDVTKILEDLPFAKLKRLLTRTSRLGSNGALFPVDYGSYQLDYLPRKEFKARRMLRQIDDVTEWSPWVVINDVGSFFQVPFLGAIKSWKVGSEADWQAIEVGKKQRATFDIADFDEISRYNALEIDLLEQLMDRFRDACIDAGYVPRKWQGPGLLAEEMLRKNGVKRSVDTPLLMDPSTQPLVSFATNAYYGGRTEVSAIGPVVRPVSQKDINSAYPYAMQFVPCLFHGKWERIEGEDKCNGLRFDRPSGRVGERYALQFGSFAHGGGPRPFWYGLPMRTQQGTIVYPAEGTGWYWSFEIDASIHQSFTTQEMWVYQRACTCRPLAFVESVYEERQRIGKDGPGIVLKLGMNSLYGKTVQSIGFPKYANPIWGSFITAFPRMMIQEFIHSSPSCGSGKLTEDGRTDMYGGACGDDVLMVATDSVTTIRERPDYPDSKELGGWSTEIHPTGIFIVQPGVYFGSSGKPSKTRGVPRTIVDAHEGTFRERFQRMVDSGDLSLGDVQVPQKIFCGIKYALHRRDLRLLGQWIEFGEADGTKGKSVSFDWTSKRSIYPALAPNNKRSYIQTYPYEGSTRIVTVPYSKDIGGLQAREESRLAFEGQPDWTPFMWEEE